METFYEKYTDELNQCGGWFAFSTGSPETGCLGLPTFAERGDYLRR